MLILFSPNGTPMWVLYINSSVSKKHGVTFNALVPYFFYNLYLFYNFINY